MKYPCTNCEHKIKMGIPCKMERETPRINKCLFKKRKSNYVHTTNRRR